MNNRPFIYDTGDSASIVRLTAHHEMELITVIDVLDRASLAIRASGFCSRTCGLQGPGSNRWPSYHQRHSCQMTNGLSVFMGGNFHLKMRSPDQRGAGFRSQSKHHVSSLHVLTVSARTHLLSFASADLSATKSTRLVHRCQPVRIVQD